MRWRLFPKLMALNLAIVLAAVLAAGIGVRQFALYVITTHDMMADEHIPPFLRDTDRYMFSLILITLLLAGAAVWLYTRSLTDRIGELKRVAGQVAAGDYRPRARAADGDDELAGLARSINRMTESLQRVESLRREMVANVAHDLRTPLSTLQGMLQAMRDGYLPLTPADLEPLQDEVGRLVRLVEDLGRLSRSDALRQEPLRLVELDLPALIADLTAQMQPLLEERGISVWLDVGPGVQPIWADRDRLVQVLVNLLDNAQKHAPAESHCRVAVRREGAGVRVGFINPAPGLAAAAVPLLFERFYRGEASRSRDVEGSGIGLALVRNLVESCGGEVGAALDQGQLEVWFTLPAGR